MQQRNNGDSPGEKAIFFPLRGGKTVENSIVGLCVFLIERHSVIEEGCLNKQQILTHWSNHDIYFFVTFYCISICISNSA